MTNNLINIILATCLLFSSLNLAAEQISPPTNRTDNKTETQFLAGETCLNQANTACAMAALAKIPSNSPYAKLLQGEIAYSNHALDQALQLLLPLQAEAQLSNVAKISLHQHLAKAFAQLQDPEQSLVHLLQVDLALAATSSSSQKAMTIANQAQIWDLLNKLDQGELLALRGNNTDDNLQGWVDLALATRNQDLNSSLKSWQLSYPDHAAATFAGNLHLPNTNATQTLKLASNSDIKVSYQANSDADKSRANAFKLGLQTALSSQGLNNTIHIASTADKADDLASVSHESTSLEAGSIESYSAESDSNESDSNEADSEKQASEALDSPAVNITQLRAPATSDYRINLLFNQNSDELNTIQARTPLTITLGFNIDDEARRIVKFAADNAISRVAIITTDDADAAQLLSHFDTVWQTAFKLNPDHHSFNIITLPSQMAANDPRLLDIQTSINAQAHDMVLLALSVANARNVKPYLNAGTPTIAFSNLHEAAPDYALNAVRFVDIPFLLAPGTAFPAHEQARAQLNSNDLLRWYALGADTLSILIAAQSPGEKEIILNGLTGTIHIQHGSISRQPSLARFSYEGIIKE